MSAHTEGGRSVVMFKHAMTKISRWCTAIVFYIFCVFRNESNTEVLVTLLHVLVLQLKSNACSIDIVKLVNVAKVH